MLAAGEKLSVSEFESRFGQEKPYYEYWHGAAVQKSMPNSIHGFLEGILVALLKSLGYRAGSEIKLKIDPDLQLIPDVIAKRGIFELPYPVSPLEIAIEILSDEDRMSRILSKCKTYQLWGFEQIYVIDPEARLVFRWVSNRLEEVDEIAGISVHEVWSALDAQLR